jgi:hypothetical protein
MTLDLATRQDILELKAALQAVLAAQAQPPAPADEPLWSVQRVAEHTHFDRKTVEKWVKEGRFDTQGKKVYLPAYEFQGRLRFKRADVEAFGLGVGVLRPSLAGERPEATKAAPAARKQKKSAPVASDQALRVA